jgi:D-xylose 1-dehydrogenase (NADP+, D-xylono-1,5-lactone-forming)
MPTNDPVRFGILGAGRIAENAVAPALREAHNATLLAVASRDPKRAARLDPERVFGTYAELLADPDVEAVYIATHNGLHRELTLAALEAGKHVLCEKPLARTAAECAEMAATAASRQLHLVEAFMYRYDPRIHRIRELVAEGAIGELRTVRVNFGFTLGRPDDVRWRQNWGGGALFDVGCYCVNVSRYLFGAEPVGVEAVGRFHPEHDVDVALHGLLRFAGDGCAMISCNFDSHGHQHLVVLGAAGEIDVAHPFTPAKETRAIDIFNGDGRKSETFGPVNTYRLEVEDLATAIRTGRVPRLPPDDGEKNLAVMEALLAAARR